MKTSAELREGFLSFFEERGHKRFPSFSLIPPPEDPSTLFISAGMQPLKPYFSGEKTPPAPRFTTVQKCLRAGGKDSDLEKVGTNARSASMFEMLGNFSFGDYFKDGAVDLAWEFVTEHLRLDPDRVWTTVFAGDPARGIPEDEVAIAAWLRKGVPRERIVSFALPENFWGPAGDTGPCGPCSELHYDRGEEVGCGLETCGPNCENCDRFIEFWNLVFMEFDLGANGKLTPLPQQNIDTGMGLERIAMVLQGVDSIFDTDGFQLIMDWIGRESGVAYGTSPDASKAHRVITDHMRGATFLIAEGVTPSNEARGYVLRRLIRRAVVQARHIGLEGVYRVPAIVVEQVGPWYPEVPEHAGEIERVVRAEEERFRETLERGLRLFEEVATGDGVSGSDAFRLHDTYGFPLEVTRELAEERGLAVDEDEFRRLMEEQRERSRRTAAFDVSTRLAGEARSEFVGYERTDVLTAIVAFEDRGDGTFDAKLEQSPFYPEGGGQVSDVGYLEHEETGERAELVRATRLGDDQVLTFRGEGFAHGDRVRAVVPWSHRYPTMANHTATHLLHKALREILGDHVRQAGSAVRPDKLRFDFTHPQALSPEERAEVERRVNEKIFENLPVRAFVTPLEEARRLGATALFGEKYGDEVRVVEIPGYSRELCGGTHVRRTAEIGPFVLLGESSVGSGARRIEAVTAGEAYAYLHGRAAEASELRAELERARKEARKPAAQETSGPDFVVYDRSEVAGEPVLVAQVTATKGGALRDLSDRLRQKEKASAVLLGSTDDGRAYLVFNVDQALADRGVDAVALVRE
ncbi:MAG: alanine--tRNA ligase, partial [Actinomycetota bacterium]|nr:alanine--tRNA ligase [Actinomycetota bacterium]